MILRVNISSFPQTCTIQLLILLDVFCCQEHLHHQSHQACDPSDDRPLPNAHAHAQPTLAPQPTQPAPEHGKAVRAPGPAANPERGAQVPPASTG